MSTQDLKTHWDSAFEEGDAAKSWTQVRPVASLAAIAAALGDAKASPIIDVGGGSSSLANELVAGGYTDVTVLDISVRAIGLARERMGESAEFVKWIVADVLRWRPERRYAVWHDRATLHFFVTDIDRMNYADVARAAIAPGGYAVIATFAPDGPTECSGLPVHRSSAEEVAELLGAPFKLERTHRERHETPTGSKQAFSWAIIRRYGD